MENNKEKIKIGFADGNTEKEYVKYLSSKYEVEVIDVVNKLLGIASLPHLIVFTGGSDVTPGLYNQNTGKYTHTNYERDTIERQTYNKFAGLVPLLGICRGAQLLTVLNGGLLIQHTTGHSMSTHPISSTSTNTVSYTMAGDHHQMMYPFNLDDRQYEILYYSHNFKSSTYLNGDNEEIELPTDFVEPEIVFYPKMRALCIQGHPEWMDETHPTVQMTLRLITEKLFNNRPLLQFNPNLYNNNEDENEDEEYLEDDDNWNEECVEDDTIF
jgi:gamma-glutamyl-gamma-aminobutyrate hydrolase PuuD